jgi:hypothetical protein
MRVSTLSETRGFLKALVEVDGDRILGFAAYECSISARATICLTRLLAYKQVRHITARSQPERAWG